MSYAKQFLDGDGRSGGTGAAAGIGGVGTCDACRNFCSLAADLVVMVVMSVFHEVCSDDRHTCYCYCCLQYDCYNSKRARLGGQVVPFPYERTRSNYLVQHGKVHQFLKPFSSAKYSVE